MTLHLPACQSRPQNTLRCQNPSSIAHQPLHSALGLCRVWLPWILGHPGRPTEVSATLLPTTAMRRALMPANLLVGTGSVVTAGILSHTWEGNTEITQESDILNGTEMPSPEDAFFFLFFQERCPNCQNLNPRLGHPSTQVGQVQGTRKGTLVVTSVQSGRFTFKSLLPSQNTRQYSCQYLKNSISSSF